MHGKIDCSERRRPEDDDSDSEELDTEEEEDEKCLDMNITYDEEETVDCADAGDN